MEAIRKHALFPWLVSGLLALLFGVLAVLQYRWIGEVSLAERERLRDGLQAGLYRVSSDFNQELGRTLSSLSPSNAEVAEFGREEAYAKRFAQWQQHATHAQLFSRVAIAAPSEGDLKLYELDQKRGRFAPMEWPTAWLRSRQWMLHRLAGDPSRAPFSEVTGLIESPRFDFVAEPPRNSRTTAPAGDPRSPDGFRRTGEQEWLLAELNLEYLFRTVVPELLSRHLGAKPEADYDFKIVHRNQPSIALFNSAPVSANSSAGASDASVAMFEVRRGGPGAGFGGGAGRGGGPRFEGGGPGPRPPDAGNGGPRFSEGNRGRWILSARHRTGSLDTLVFRTRLRNLAVSGGILLLMIAAIAALFRYSRQAQHLADLQMEFVAGVSHELRTPLTVIRTAAHNLRGKIANNPVQVERYGSLIQSESEKLTAIVEQVLRFAGSQAGRVIREREPMAVETIVEDALLSVRGVLEGAHCRLDKSIEPGLPVVLGDSLALQHALQNLISNAVKYGTDENKWVGLSVSRIDAESHPFVEIRVSDKGQGIPEEELKKVFDPFFRGQRAIRDQVHGTGLGLSLVKKIVDAHGGTVAVESKPNEGTQFIVRLPVAPSQYQDEFAHTTG